MTDVMSRPVSRDRRARYIAASVMLVVAVLVLILATRPAASGQNVSSPLVGSIAPPVEGTALDGREVSLAELSGRPVVVA